MAAVVLKRTGQKMPLVGFGLWKVTKSSCADTVYNAIKCGYRLFDGAGDYGNEKEAGEGVRRAISEGLVKREDLFITSKLWNTFHKYEHAKEMVRYQLKLWGIDYFDLFLIHFPISLAYVDPAHRYPPEWFGDDGKVYTPMEEIVDEELAKNIGLSNCTGSLVLDVLNYARIEPQVLQVELHPYLSQDHLVALMQELGIAVTAYSSLGPQSFVELSMDKKIPSLLAHDVISQVANAHRKTPAQVLLRWATQRGIAVIPKSNNQVRLAENLQCTTFDLSDLELKAIGSLNKNIRFNEPRDIDPRLAVFA